MNQKISVNAYGVVSPSLVEGGTAGENKVNSLTFELDQTLVKDSSLYQIQALTVQGVFDITEHLAVNNSSVTYDIPNGWSVGGGVSAVRVVITTPNGEESPIVWYSDPVSVKFKPNQQSKICIATAFGLINAGVQAKEYVEKAKAYAESASGSELSAKESELAAKKSELAAKEYAESIIVDTELSLKSTNPVQNKVIAQLIKGTVQQVQLVEGDYIGTNDGLFKPDGKCSRTDYISCDGKDVIRIDFNGVGTVDGTRAWWYDADKNPLSKMTIYKAQMETVGWSEIPVVDGAAYYAVSDYTEEINQFVFETESTEGLEDKLNAVIESNAKKVSSVNGITPDESGNVNIEVSVVADAELDTESENPVQNKVIAQLIKGTVQQVQLVEGDYIGTNDGLFKPDGKCSRTDYISCDGKDVIRIDFNGVGTVDGTRAWWYDADKNPLSKMTIYKAQMETVGWSEIPVVDGAAYYAVSDYTEEINQFVFETESTEGLEDKLNAVIESNAKKVASVNGITPDESGNVNIEIPTPSPASASVSETDRECYLLRKELPEYYTAYPSTADTIDADCYIDGKTNSVPDGNSFLFVTDMHYIDNVNNSFPLMLYAYKKLGLNTVVHGGDVVEAYNNDKNKGALELRKWANEMRACFGEKMLPVFGNHDANWAGLSFSTATETDIAETVIPYSVVESIFLKGYKQNIVQETDEEINQRYAAWIDDITDDADKEEFVAWCKLHFYYDDKKNKTRHIVLNRVGFSPLFKKYFRSSDIELRLQYEWLYDVLLDTPDDYNIVVTCHFLVEWLTNSITNIPALNIMKLLSLAKTNGSAWVTYANGWANNSMTYNSTTFSFEGRNRTGKIITLCGHAHWDYACVCHTAADGTYKSEDYTDDLAINDDGILCIMTQTDAIRSANYDMSQYPATSVQATMTEGTVTEQCFDVVTISDDAVTCTRFGAGEDRIFKY